MSLLKILFTAAIIYAVWIIYKYRSRIITAAHKTMQEEKARAAAARPPAPKAQDLLPCPKCGAYVASGMTCVCERV